MTLNDLREFMQISVDGTANSFTNDIDSFIGLMQSSGVSQSEIKNILKNDLAEGGRIFGSLKNNSASSIRNGIESASNISSREAFANAGIERFRWVSTGNNVCPDCENRAGVIGEMEYFDTVGLPKSGFSVCGINCQCQLVPIEYKAEGDIIKKKLDKKILVDRTNIKFAGKLKTKKEAVDWLKSNGVRNIEKLSLDNMNELSIAVKNLPSKYRDKLVIGDFAYYKKTSGFNVSSIY